MYKISIIGSGTVGGAIGKVFTKYGYHVIFYDLERERLKELASRGYKVAETLEEAVLNTDISFICVPTPSNNGSPQKSEIFGIQKSKISDQIDRTYLDTALSGVLDVLTSKDGYHTIAIKSTILPGIVEGFDGGNCGICLNPEFLRSETPEEDFENQPVIIGSIDERAAEILKVFYEDFRRRTEKNFKIFVTDTKTAAMIKYVSNCLLATKISLFNEIADICKKIGVDPRIVVNNVITDRYSTIEQYRRDFLSLGFQDECLPKDLDAFLSFCKDLGYKPELLSAVKEVNERIKRKR